MNKYELTIRNKKTDKLLVVHKFGTSVNDAYNYVHGFLNSACELKSSRLLSSSDSEDSLDKLFRK